MLARSLGRIMLRNFKSFEELDLSLRPINILIGPNGSGKSNLISLFKMLRYIRLGKFQTFVIQSGGADKLLYYGPKVSDHIYIELWFQGETEGTQNAYQCKIVPARGTLFIEEERVFFHDIRKYPGPYDDILVTYPSFESRLSEFQNKNRIVDHVIQAMKSWQVYPFPRYKRLSACKGSMRHKR